MATGELPEDIAQEIAQTLTDITIKHAPQAWVKITTDIILKNSELAIKAIAVDSDDVQHDIEIDSSDKNTLEDILLQPMTDMSCEFFRFEVDNEGDCYIEYEVDDYGDWLTNGDFKLKF